MNCELHPDGAGRRDDRATKCSTCPRDGEPRLRAVPNFGVNGGQLVAPNPYVLDTVYLCDGCAVLRSDVL